MRFTLTPVREWSAKCRGIAVVSIAFATGCMRLLGIDGKYSPAANSGGSDGTSGKASSSGEAGGGGPGISAFDGSAGGRDGDSNGGTGPSMVPDASLGGKNSGRGGAGGGSGGTGGRMSSGGSAGASGGAGGKAPLTDGGPPPCPSGSYHGSYSGTHHPSSGGPTLAAPIAGQITLLFVEVNNTSVVVTGTLNFSINPMTGGLTGTFMGAFDCTKGTGSATLSMARVSTVLPVFTGPVDGTLDIKAGAAPKLGGSFAIHETLNLSFAIGGGTWFAN